MAQVGIYIGSTSDSTSNVTRTLTKWGRYLSEYHDLDAFGSADLPASARDFYTSVDTRARSSRTPFTKILQAYRDCLEYQRRRSPDVLMQLWKYKTHAPAITLAGRRTGAPTIIRCPIDVSNEYRGVDGIQKAGVYVLDHGVGHIPVKWSNKLIAMGPNGRDQLKERGANPNDIVILPPPRADSSRFEPPDDKVTQKRELDLPTDTTLALYVGRITKLKGMEFLEDVIDSVRRKKDITFVLVGDGPYKRPLKEKFDEDTLHTPGYVEYDRIDRYYKAADVYVHPSPYEGIPLVIIEALQCGVPVIARESGDVGFVTPNVVDTSEQMADKLVTEQWSLAWKNYKYFGDEYQRDTLKCLIDTIG